MFKLPRLVRPAGAVTTGTRVGVVVGVLPGKGVFVGELGTGVEPVQLL